MLNEKKTWRKPELHQISQKELTDVILHANASGLTSPGWPSQPPRPCGWAVAPRP